MDIKLYAINAIPYDMNVLINSISI